MKKVLLMGALALSTLAISAQDLAGKWFVGGNFGYSQSETKVGGTSQGKPKSYAIKPLIGTFISSDMAVGAEIGFVGSKDGGENLILGDAFEGYQSDVFVIAPLARKYFALGNSGFNFFGQAALPVMFGNTKEVEGGDKLNLFGLGVELRAGFDYIINDTFSFETSLNVANFTYAQAKKGDNKTTSLDLGVNPFENLGAFQVGFKMFF